MQWYIRKEEKAAAKAETGHTREITLLQSALLNLSPVGRHAPLHRSTRATSVMRNQSNGDTGLAI